MLTCYRRSAFRGCALLLNCKIYIKDVKTAAPARTRSRFPPSPAVCRPCRTTRRNHLMKQHIKAIALTAILAASLLAQRPFGVMTSSAPPDPATLVANQVARLTALLTLTTAQAAQATTIFTNAQTSITPLQTTLST